MSVVKQLGIQSLLSLIILPVFLGALVLYGLGDGNKAAPKAAATTFVPVPFEEVAAKHPSLPVQRKQIIFYLVDSASQVGPAQTAEDELASAALDSGGTKPERSYAFYNVMDEADEQRVSRVIAITSAEMGETGMADVIVVDLRPQPEQ